MPAILQKELPNGKVQHIDYLFPGKLTNILFTGTKEQPAQMVVAACDESDSFTDIYKVDGQITVAYDIEDLPAECTEDSRIRTIHHDDALIIRVEDRKQGRYNLVLRHLLTMSHN